MHVYEIRVLYSSYSLLQKSSNTMMLEVQCITAHSAYSHGTEYYLLHDSTALYPVSMIEEVHSSPPFSRDNMRVFDTSDLNNITAIPISNNVSYEFL